MQNGTVTGFDVGVFLFSTDAATVRHVRALANDVGILAGAGSTVTGNTARGNAGVGILAGDGNTVTGNTARGNGPGIVAGDVSTVSGNTAAGNDGNGIFAEAGSTVSGNTARGNTDVGILVECPANVFDNTATANDSGTDLELLGIPGDCNVANNIPTSP